MNKEDIIRMAREAGCGWAHNGTQPSLVGEEMLERFAALVASHEREAEREACAKVCDARYICLEDIEARACAAAIRARGE